MKNLELELLKFKGRLDEHRENERIYTARLEKNKERLTLYEAVNRHLENIARDWFSQSISVLEERLSIALQEVLGISNIECHVDVKMHNKRTHLEFYITRNGHREELDKAQGGSVLNILSVGLRFYGLLMLDEKEHRPFLIFDEQDAWIQPARVPYLMKIIRDAGQHLGIQTLVISHHDVSLIGKYADRIYELDPREDGVYLKEVEFHHQE